MVRIQHSPPSHLLCSVVGWKQPWESGALVNAVVDPSGVALEAVNQLETLLAANSILKVELSSYAIAASVHPSHSNMSKALFSHGGVPLLPRGETERGRLLWRKAASTTVVGLRAVLGFHHLPWLLAIPNSPWLSHHLCRSWCFALSCNPHYHSWGAEPLVFITFLGQGCCTFTVRTGQRVAHPKWTKWVTWIPPVFFSSTTVWKKPRVLMVIKIEYLCRNDDSSSCPLVFACSKPRVHWGNHDLLFSGTHGMSLGKSVFLWEPGLLAWSCSCEDHKVSQWIIRSEDN